MELSTTDQVIKALGGYWAVSDMTGRRTYQAAFNWKCSGGFPADTYIVLQTALRERGHTAPARLWGMIGAPQ